MGDGIHRRSFFRRCGAGASTLFLPRSFAFAQTAHELAPDLEQHYQRIAAILAQWSAALLASPSGIPHLAGSGPESAKQIRAGALEIWRVNWAEPPSLVKYFAEFSKLLTAQLEVSRLEMNSGRIDTRVEYEFVGTGKDFYREQRSGFWRIQWEPHDYRVASWSAGSETRARSASPWYADVCEHALGEDKSYSAQLLRGVDYWRTVLDAASGIDIYGHNGVSFGDIDGDGFDDLYLCQPAGLPNRLFRNRGDGTFEDITESSGVGILDNTACALFTDFRNSGRQDLIVVRAEGPVVFVNEGGGKFRRNPDAFQFANPPQGTFTGAAAADYDRDGWLDIYFCLYVFYQGANQYKYPVPYYAAENGPPNFLMRNHRDGTFRDVTAESGLNRNNTRYSFCCGWGDENGDGWPDLYVVNDFGRKNLYRNNGNGTFTDIAAQAGAEDIGAGMSVCWFDYDRDGREDLFVANMWTAAGERISNEPDFQREAPEAVRAAYRKHAMGNSLLRNQGNGDFEDATARAHVGMGRWSWSSEAFDFDHDGFSDLYVTNGMLSGPIHEDLNGFFWRQVVAKSPNEARMSADYEQGWNTINDLIRSDHSWSGYERNVLLANNGDGTFSDVSGAAGLDFIEDGRAFALADFDGDGRQEIFLKNRNAPQLRILKNIRQDLPPAIAFRLRGTKSNRDAIGAVVTVKSEAGRQTRSLQAGSGFLSQHSKELFFGLGNSKEPVKATIRWPSGLVQHLENLPLNHRIRMEEGNAEFLSEPFRVFIPVAPDLKPQRSEELPANVETWLLEPVMAPGISARRSALLHFGADRQVSGVSIPVIAGSEELFALYNVLYRYLYDRHRELTRPAAFLTNANGEIVKIYQGHFGAETVEADAQRIPRTRTEHLAKALPFTGGVESYEFGRNYLSLGSVFYQHNYFGPSEAFFRRAQLDDPVSAEAEYGIGSACLAQNRVSEARASFERTVKLTARYPSTMPKAWNNLGLIAGREGRNDEAIGYFERALQIDPDNVIALENLGSAYRAEKRWDEARKTLERAIELDSNSAEANYSLGMVFAQTGDTQRAYECLQLALKMRPAYPEALNNLGILFLRTARPEQAIESFKECIRVAPQFESSYLNLARVYMIEEQREKAKAVVLELLKQHPENEQARKMLAQVQ